MIAHILKDKPQVAGDLKFKDKHTGYAVTDQLRRIANSVLCDIDPR